MNMPEITNHVTGVLQGIFLVHLFMILGGVTSVVMGMALMLLLNWETIVSAVNVEVWAMVSSAHNYLL